MCGTSLGLFSFIYESSLHVQCFQNALRPSEESRLFLKGFQFILLSCWWPGFLSVLESLSALWRTFSVLVATPRAQEPKKKHALQGVCSRARFLIGFSLLFGCLGPLKTRIPCGRGTQNHIFDRRRKKHDFRQILWSFYGPFGTMLGTFGSPLEPEGACFSFLSASIFYQFFSGFWVPRGPQKRNSAAQGLLLWCYGEMKRHILRKA